MCNEWDKAKQILNQDSKIKKNWIDYLKQNATTKTYRSVRIYRRKHFACGIAWNKNRSKDDAISHLFAIIRCKNVLRIYLIYTN